MVRRQPDPASPDDESSDDSGRGSVREVLRRDGARERFDAARLSASIHRAALAVGQGELLLAEELATLVALVLESEQAGDSVSTRSVREAAERVLMETGHHDVARSYILQQARDDEAGTVRSDSARDGAARKVGDAGGGSAVRVASLGRECLHRFDVGVLTQSIVLDVGLKNVDAKAIAIAVERRVA